ncbi:Tmem231 [Symbiodinium sp. CCMP2592]|nr:Tmem231 [Symbiodinium sp. CCMP2592]
MTLWPFQHVVCHSIAYQRLFVAPRCSTAYCLWVLAVITLVVVPLFATFAADNVWVKESFYRVQPVVTFANQLYVLIGGNTTETMVGWSTQPQLQVLLPKQVKVPTVRSSTEDNNRDGIADTLQLSLDFPSEGQTYRSVLLLAVYDVQIQGKVAEQLSGLVALDASSPYGSSGLWVHGQLSFRQKLPLYQSPEARSVYVSSPLDVNWRSNWIPDKQPLSLEELLSRYAQRWVQREHVRASEIVPLRWSQAIAQLW